MANDLILVDGQEGFVDLELLEEWRCMINGVSRASGYHQILNLSFHKNMRGRWVYIPSNTIERNKLISMQISYKNLSRLYYDKLHKFDERIDALKKKMKLAKNPVKRAYWNDAVRAVLKEKNQAPTPYVDFGVIYGLLKKLPEKYHEKRTQNINLQRMSNVDSMYLVCEILKIRVIAIPYLESQHQLGRIDLTQEELTMVKAMKELLSIKDDAVTFDSYIDVWTKKLIKEVESGRRYYEKESK